MTVSTVGSSFLLTHTPIHAHTNTHVHVTTNVMRVRLYMSPKDREMHISHHRSPHIPTTCRFDHGWYAILALRAHKAFIIIAFITAALLFC